jgi:hypothetical protein
MKEIINDAARLRLCLLKETGYNVETAKKCWDFVKGRTEEIEAVEDASNTLADGVYIIGSNGEVISFIGNDTKLGDIKPAYIGIVEGIRSIKVALYDAAKGKDIELTAKKDTTSYSGYINNYMDAVQDWNGNENTEHLKEIGLNSTIDLKDGEYIPALAEMYLLCRNRKQVNEALRFIGAEILDDLWYWTSTEYSSTFAWYLGLGNGYAYYSTKAAGQYRVRAVSAFLPLNS